MEQGLLLALGIVGACVIGIVAGSMMSRKRGSDAAQLEQLFSKVSQESLSRAHDQFFRIAKEQFASDRSAARQELDHRKDMIAQLVEEMRKDMVQSRQSLQSSDRDRVATFTSVQKELEFNRTIVHELRATVDDLKKVLSNNQLRGSFGEQVAQDLLKMAGFVIGQDYVANREQESAETRPDFTIFLPDKTRVNIDVKFPYASLVKAFATNDISEREGHLKQFAVDVRAKIKQITSREYINPSERTVDFVIMFIPNEMIFSYIYEQLNEVWEEGMRKKVIMAGPFSFTAMLRMIRQAYTNFRYQENLHQVIGLIQKFETEYQKFSEELDRLGDRLQSTSKQFDAVSGTRSRALTRVIDQIRNQKLESGEQKEILE